MVVGSICTVLLWGLKLGIDFTGGSLLEAEYKTTRPSPDAIKKALEPLALGTVVVQPSGERRVFLRFKDVSEDVHQNILAALGKAEGAQSPVAEKRFDTIGPVIGSELKRNSLLAIGFALIAIVLYIAWAFRKVSKPVASWKYGLAALVALAHDVVIPVGVFALLGKMNDVEIDTLFITALLTVLGFSVHDTIVVFDRIRENLHKLRQPEPFDVTVNRSVNETLVRSLNTSLTVLLVLVAVYVLGGATTKLFSLALMIGVTFGTYSSIFVASPILVIWSKWGRRKK